MSCRRDWWRRSLPSATYFPKFSQSRAARIFASADTKGLVSLPLRARSSIASSSASMTARTSELLSFARGCLLSATPSSSCSSRRVGPLSSAACLVARLAERTQVAHVARAAVRSRSYVVDDSSRPAAELTCVVVASHDGCTQAVPSRAHLLACALPRGLVLPRGARVVCCAVTRPGRRVARAAGSTAWSVRPPGHAPMLARSPRRLRTAPRGRVLTLPPSRPLRSPAQLARRSLRAFAPDRSPLWPACWRLLAFVVLASRRARRSTTTKLDETTRTNTRHEQALRLLDNELDSSRRALSLAALRRRARNVLSVRDGARRGKRRRQATKLDDDEANTRDEARRDS